MKELLKAYNWMSGLQWLFFIFTNIIVIPITVGAAFELPAGKVVSLLQLSFIVTGIACILQARYGHGRGIMEGQSGLWWGVILTLVTTASAQGIPLPELGGSLVIGVVISGVLTILIGLTGSGPWLSKLFNPSVMGVFMFLFGCQLISIFLKGMLGIPFGNTSEPGHIHLSISLVSVIIAVIVIIISVKSPPGIRRYSLDRYFRGVDYIYYRHRNKRILNRGFGFFSSGIISFREAILEYQYYINCCHDRVA